MELDKILRKRAKMDLDLGRQARREMEGILARELRNAEKAKSQAASFARKRMRLYIRSEAIEAYKRGEDVHTIARDKSLSVATIRAYILDELGIVPKAVKPSKEGMAFDLKSGMSYQQVADKYGVSTATVRVAEKMYRDR